MTAAISIFVAVILTSRAWRAANRFEGGLIPAEHLLIFLLMTGMFQTGGYSLGMNLSAWRLLVWILLVGFVLAREGPAMPRLTVVDLPIALYGLFLLWCLWRFMDAPSLGYGARNLLKIVYPFMVLLLARKSAHAGHLGVYLVPMVGASLIISIFSCGLSEKIPYLVYNPFTWGVFWPRATFAEHAAIIVGIILVILWGFGNAMPVLTKRLYIVSVVLLIMSPVAVSYRAGILATAASMSGYALARYKLKAIPVMGVLLLLGTAAFTYLPWVRTHAFYDPDQVSFGDIVRGDVELSNVNSSGRFALWEDLMDRFYHPEPLKGSGLGTTQEHMYEMSQVLYGGLQVPHSDYVMLLCDTGIVGLLLYLLTAISALNLAVKYMWYGATMELRAAAAIVMTSFLASLCATGFDNVFNYTLAVHSLPFAFLGILLGMLNNEPAHEIIDPWQWSRTYIWSSFVPLRTGSQRVPQVPPAREESFGRIDVSV